MEEPLVPYGIPSSEHNSIIITFIISLTIIWRHTHITACHNPYFRNGLSYVLSVLYQLKKIFESKRPGNWLIFDDFRDTQ